MSSSRSDVVTQCVCLSVFSFVPFFLLVSLNFHLFLKSFNVVSRQFKGYLKFNGSFKEVLRVFHGSFKGVSRKFNECFKEDSRVFQGSFRGCFKRVSRLFQVLFKGVS